MCSKFFFFCQFRAGYQIEFSERKSHRQRLRRMAPLKDTALLSCHLWTPGPPGFCSGHSGLAAGVGWLILPLVTSFCWLWMPLHYKCNPLRDYSTDLFSTLGESKRTIFSLTLWPGLSSWLSFKPALSFIPISRKIKSEYYTTFTTADVACHSYTHSHIESNADWSWRVSNVLGVSCEILRVTLPMTNIHTNWSIAIVQQAGANKVQQSW